MPNENMKRTGGDKPPSPLDESKQALSMMATPEFRKEMSGLIRSRSPLIYLVSTEEKRVLEYFRHYAKIGGFRTFVWDCYNGVLNIVNMQPAALVSGDHSDPVPMLDFIVKEATEEADASLDDADDEATRKQSRGNIYIMLDFHRFLRPCTPEVERRLRTLTRIDSNTVVVLVGPTYETTPALDKDVRVIDFPYPNKGEIKVALYSAVQGVYGKGSPTEKDTQDREREIVNAVTGLSYGEVCASFAKSIVMHKGLDVPTLLKEKQEVIRKTGVLEFFDPKVGLDDIGGLGNLTDWLKDRECLFHEDARAYGLSQPKGALMIGVPGSGKSLAAKATASAYKIPLLRLDFGALFASHIGESERQARQAIQIAERVAPCVIGSTKIFFDGQEIEIEKVFNDHIGKEDMELVGHTSEDGGCDVIKFADEHLTVGVSEHGEKTTLKILGVICRPCSRKLLKITLEDGNSVTVTDNHKLLVKTSSGTTWKQASELTTEDDLVSF